MLPLNKDYLDGDEKWIAGPQSFEFLEIPFYIEKYYSFGILLYIWKCYSFEISFYIGIILIFSSCATLTHNSKLKMIEFQLWFCAKM